MRRRTFARDLVGTILVFVALIAVVIIMILGEFFLDGFKSH